ncbi:MAG: magnesium and cobalt transport protein CorA [Nocardioides sp.]
MIVDTALYRDGVRCAPRCDPADLMALRAELRGDGDFVWLGLFEPTRAELDRAATAFGLHPLAVEDAFEAGQRPKLELFDDSLFLSVKTLWYVETEDAVETGEVHIFMGRDFVITVRHGDGAELQAARHSLESRTSVLNQGPSAVVYAVCNLVVDGYESVAAALDIDVSEVEESVFSAERTRDSARIYVLKREIAEVRRAVRPLGEPLRRFAGGTLPGMDATTQPFFRDVVDHLARVSETVEGLELLLTAAFEAHLAAISVQQNEDMRKISAGVGLVALPTLIAGIYGMNFDTMPELHWLFGYPFALLLMALSSGALWVLFKKSGWL